MAAPVTLLVGTRKGACILCADAAHKNWQLDAPYFLGNIVNHRVADPRDGGASCTGLPSLDPSPIPRSLFRYTGGQRQVEAEGESLAAFLEALNARYPGMRHRIADAQNRTRKSIRFSSMAKSPSASTVPWIAKMK